jgi:hypothetical protein
MSDVEYQLEKIAEAAYSEVTRLMERGNYYRERKENSQALNNYVLALEAYANYASKRSKVISISVAVDTQDVNPTNAALVFSQTLFDLCYLLKIISDFYNTDSIVRVYLESRLVQISKKLDEYERVFDGEDLTRYGNIKDYARSLESSVRQHQERLSSLKPLKEESDELFKTIRKALSDISSQKICPLKLEESDGCFIATAVYSDYFHPDIDTFREFRDNVLMKSFLGCLLVKVYYKIGPKVARYVTSRLYIKKIIRLFLEHLADTIRSRRI